MADNNAKQAITIGVITAIISAGIGGVVTYLATYRSTVEGARQAAKVVAEMQEQERMAPHVSVECDATDVWREGCSSCHGKQHPGGKVTDREDAFRFNVKATKPITLTSATLHVYRVKFLARPYTLAPTDDIRQITYRSAQPNLTHQAKHVYYCTRALLGNYRPEVTEHTIPLRDLRDGKATLADIQLGKVNVSYERTISLNFVLDDQYQKEVMRLRQSLVQVLGVVVFHTDDRNDIVTDPFLITLRADALSSPPDLPAPKPASSGPTPQPF